MDRERKGTVRYVEAAIRSAGTEIVFSLWEAPDPVGAVVFSPATMVHPLFYAPLLKGLAGEGSIRWDTGRAPGINGGIRFGTWWRTAGTP
jgi:hypothetical protein